MAASWTRTHPEAGGVAVRLDRAGKGPPLVILHHDIGSPERLPAYDALAGHFDVLLPQHPGYGDSQRPEWMRSARDLAILYRGLLADLGVEKPVLLGLGFGGWLAAEMAAMAPRDTGRLILVGAMGIKPPQGDILDQALVSHTDYAAAGFHDPKAFAAVYGEVPDTDQLVQWDLCREMSFRIAWKPYMYSATMPHLLGSVQVPALVIWGDDDKVVPLSAGEVYAQKLPKATLEIVAGCGHCVEMEKPAELVRLVTTFCNRG